MKCNVCQASWDEAASSLCPHCHYDAAAPDARDPSKLAAARNALRDKTTAYAPDKRVTRWDRLQPWAAVLLGAALFVFWLRACASHGFF